MGGCAKSRSFRGGVRACARRCARLRRARARACACVRDGSCATVLRAARVDRLLKPAIESRRAPRVVRAAMALCACRASHASRVRRARRARRARALRMRVASVPRRGARCAHRRRPRHAHRARRTRDARVARAVCDGKIARRKNLRRRKKRRWRKSSRGGVELGAALAVVLRRRHGLGRCARQAREDHVDAALRVGHLLLRRAVEVRVCLAQVGADEEHVCDGLDEGKVVLRGERLRDGDGRRRRGDLTPRLALRRPHALRLRVLEKGVV